MSDKIFAVFVVGPTASGKTGLGAALGRAINGEVISADSMQIYKGMPIAAAVPDAEEMLSVPHYMLEFLEPSEEFTVADFACRARETAFDIAKRGKTPIFVGGTGLYINAIADNIRFIPQKSDEGIRARITEEFECKGADRMLEKLAEIDPETASRLHQNDKKRIIRAFEVFELTGGTVSAQNEASRTEESPFCEVMIGITYRDRERLYDRINLRVDKMLEKGLLKEAQKSLENVPSGGSVQAIGHKELYPYLKGECPLEDAVESLKRATRRYAKRQLTWFRRDERINWIYADECEDVLKEALKIIDKAREEKV